MKIRLVKDNEVVVSREEYEEYKTIYHQYNAAISSILNEWATYEVLESKYLCDVVASFGIRQIPIKRFASDDPDYNRVCAEELVELLNQ